MCMGDTIVALSSGSLPAGVAVLRLSGPQTRSVVSALCDEIPQPRKMVLVTLSYQSQSIDTGLVVYFPAPHSFTGEDCAELQVHGSLAVVKRLLEVISALDGVRLAEAGEFTRRAFENGKLNLVEAEGLSDLIVAQTEGQRLQAFQRMDGALTQRIDGWRQQLLDLRAQIEARLDFSDESDVDVSLPASWHADLGSLIGSVESAIDESKNGRIIRDGFRVALAGPPNAGKSSLLNALSRSDVAIVSPEAGTTRDVREVPLDLGGQLVLLIDLAGLRQSDSLAEAEGVRRAEEEIAGADLVLWLKAADDPQSPTFTHSQLVCVGTKSDLGVVEDAESSVSTVDNVGVAELLNTIEGLAKSNQSHKEPALLSHARDLAALNDALDALRLVESSMAAPELAAEVLRRASDSMARLVGAMDSEQVLDQLFSRFCIGK